jgi:FAD/FMN-containing dehydrogenase
MYSSNNGISNSIVINEIQKDLDEVIYTNIISIKGSISAEHGIGLLKKKVLPLTKSTTEMNLMKQIKQTLDPKNIMNPGKIF